MIISTIAKFFQSLLSYTSSDFSGYMFPAYTPFNAQFNPYQILYVILEITQVNDRVAARVSCCYIWSGQL